jgi:hypothetical protein
MLPYMLPWRRIVHGRIRLPMRIINKAIARKEKPISRNSPKGSFAKEAGRKVSNRGMVFIKTNGSSKGPCKTGRC